MDQRRHRLADPRPGQSLVELGAYPQRAEVATELRRAVPKSQSSVQHGRTAAGAVSGPDASPAALRHPLASTNKLIFNNLTALKAERINKLLVFNMLTALTQPAESLR